MNIINKISYNTIGIILLIIFIKIMYKKRYTKQANIYISNQLILLGVGCLGCTFILYLYYSIESLLHIDGEYLNGICLAIFLGGGGLLINKLYFHFKTKRSMYKPTNEEYLFIITVSFISIMIRMIFDGIIGFVIPISLLLGRFMWLDTRDIHSIAESVKMRHNRIKETAILFLVGTILLSFLVEYFESYYIVNLCFPFIYGIILYYPYNFIISKIDKKLIK